MSKKLSEQEAQGIFEQNTMPEDAKPKGLPAFSLYAELDTKKQPLKYIKPFEKFILSLPAGLPSMAREVLIRLFRCFAKAGHVSEGVVGDIMFGFSVPTMEEENPLPPEATWLGLKELSEKGYLDFKYPNGETADPSTNRIVFAWVRYRKQLLDLVYEVQK